MADSAARRAEVLIELGRPAQALELLSKALASEPDNAALLLGLARAHLNLGEHQEALEAAEQAVALVPDDEYGHRLVSDAYTRLNQGERAVGAAREAVRLAPHDWENHAQLAVALTQLNGYLFFTALPVLLGSRIGGFIATALGGRRREAWRVALHTVTLAPDEPGAHRTVSYVAISIGDYRAAESALGQVLRLAPQDTEALSALSTVHRRAGRQVRAAVGFGTVLSENPSDDYASNQLDWTARRMVRRNYILLLPFVMVAGDLAMGDRWEVLWYRIMTSVVVLVIVTLAARMWWKLTPSLRRYLWRLLIRNGWYSYTVALLVSCITCFSVTIFLDAEGRRVWVFNAVFLYTFGILFKWIMRAILSLGGGQDREQSADSLKQRHLRVGPFVQIPGIRRLVWLAVAFDMGLSAKSPGDDELAESREMAWAVVGAFRLILLPFLLIVEIVGFGTEVAQWPLFLAGVMFVFVSSLAGWLWRGTPRRLRRQLGGLPLRDGWLGFAVVVLVASGSLFVAGAFSVSPKARIEWVAWSLVCYLYGIVVVGWIFRSICALVFKIKQRASVIYATTMRDHEENGT